MERLVPDLPFCLHASKTAIRKMAAHIKTPSRRLITGSYQIFQIITMEI
jgi:hypothetical protein